MEVEEKFGEVRLDFLFLSCVISDLETSDFASQSRIPNPTLGYATFAVGVGVGTERTFRISLLSSLYVGVGRKGGSLVICDLRGLVDHIKL